jgi:anionic cell wall polymer biosynthesis LytR-Cps2A-Psr (LCP) family protein
MSCECFGIPFAAFHHFFQAHLYTHLGKVSKFIEKISSYCATNITLGSIKKTGRNDGNQRMEFQNILAPRSI